MGPVTRENTRTTNVMGLVRNSEYFSILFGSLIRAINWYIFIDFNSKFFNIDGSRYEGEYKNDLREGQGWNDAD